MKKLKQLFESAPGYYKRGNSSISALVGLKEMTVNRYKRSTEYREGKKDYIRSISEKNSTMVPSGSTICLDTVVNLNQA